MIRVVPKIRANAKPEQRVVAAVHQPVDDELGEEVQAGLPAGSGNHFSSMNFTNLPSVPSTLNKPTRLNATPFGWNAI